MSGPDERYVVDGEVKDGKYRDVLELMLTRWDYSNKRWDKIRDESKEDKRNVAGDPWDPTDRRAREDAGRPVLTFDELSQYTNQLVNSVRQHKRAIQVTAIGFGANDQTAQLRQDLFRQIEYRSNAQQHAYTPMFQNCVEGSYGFCRVKATYCDDPKVSGGDGSAFNQELVIEGLANPDLVTVDPDILTPDGSDMQFAWISESWDLETYRKRFPKARVRNFSADLAPVAPGWIDSNRIRIAEYWTIDYESRNLLLFTDVPIEEENGQVSLGAIEVYEDDLDEKDEFAGLRGMEPKKSRMVDVPTVRKYLTNGFEVLEKPEVWPGKTIPIVTCFGKRMYVDEGAGAELIILSLPRLARDPFMAYCYARTSEIELIGMQTKFPYFVREGSLTEKSKLDLQKSQHEPVAFIEVKGAANDMLPNGEVPEFPIKNTYNPEIQQIDSFCEAARRAIQAAMGISPLPTNAQKINEKSGKALQEIDDAEQQGSFHFVDAYEAAITRVGAILNEVCPVYYDTARDVPLRNQAGETRMVRINDPNPGNFKPGQEEPMMVGMGQHDVTLSSGPSFDSEREASNEFASEILTQVEPLAGLLGPQKAQQLLSLTVKLKNAGPIGDEIAEILMPPDPGQGPTPEQAQQLAQENAQLKQDIATKATEKKIEQETTLQKTQMECASREKVAWISQLASIDKTQMTVDAENARTMMDAEQKGAEKALALKVATVHKIMDHTQAERAQAAEHAHAGAVLALEHAHDANLAQTPPPVDPNAVPAQPNA